MHDLPTNISTITKHNNKRVFEKLLSSKGSFADTFNLHGFFRSDVFIVVCNKSFLKILFFKKNFKKVIKE